MFGLLKSYRNYFVSEFAALGSATFFETIKENFSCTCKIVCFFIIVFLLSNKVSGQVTIASDGFNNSSTLFNASFSDAAAGYSNLSTTASDFPASTPYFIEGTHAIRVLATNSTGDRSAILTSNSNINTCSYSNVEMSLRVMAVSRTSSSDGPGSSDYILIEVSTNGGTNYNPVLRLQGNGLSGSYWSYASGTGVASTTFTEYSTSPILFTSGLGNATTNGYSTLKITGLPQIPNLRFRITVLIDDPTSDTPMWCIDDFKVTGQSLSSPLTLTTTKTDNSNCTPVPCTYTGPKLLINEIRINPGVDVNSIGSVTGTSLGQEYIELYNPNPCNPIDISCFLLGGNTGADDKSNWTIRFPSGTIIPPLGFYTIAGDQVAGGNFYFKDYVAGGNFKNGFIVSADVSPWLYNQEDWKVLYDANGNPLSGLAWGTSGSSIANINSDIRYNQPVQVVNRSGCPSLTSLPTIRNVLNLNNPNIPVTFIDNVLTPGTNTRSTDGGAWGPLRAVTSTSINSCNGVCNTQPSSCDGTATVTPSGGVPPYLIAWDAAARNQNTQTAIKLCPGTYGVTITDACGNVTSSTVTVTTNATCTTVPFSECNLVTYKVGDGSTALSNNAFPVRIDEVSTAGSLIQSIQSTITQDANQTSVGYLNSYNGFLGLPGYNLFPGSISPASIRNAKATQIFDANSVITSTTIHPTTTSSPFSGESYRSVVPLTNNTFYCAGNSTSANGGVWYYNGTSFLQICTTPNNVRNIEIYNGQLYLSTGTTSTTAPLNGQGIYRVGSGLPTTSGQTVTPLINQSGGQPYGFSISPDGCTAYVADDRSAPNGGVQKWVKSGATWSLAYTIGSPSRGLVVDYSGSNPVIYATTTAASNNTIIKITDAGSSSSSSIIRSAGSNYVFRGIDFTPNSYKTINITQQPVGFTICEGSPSQALSVTASVPSGGLTYQWFRNTSNDYCGATAISGETNSTYSPPTTPPGTVYYFVRITNNCATILNSNIVAVTVNVAATVTASASNLNPCTGVTVNLTGSFGGSATSAVWAIKSGGGTLNTSVTPPTYTAPSAAGTVTLSYTSNDPDGPTGPCPAATIDVVLTVANCNTCPTVWGNIQSPGSGTVCSGGTFDVYGQVYIPGVTEAAGQGANVTVQLGWSTTNSNPISWTNWINANYNTLGPSPSNIDEYFATLTLPPGNYYYAFRYSINGCPYVYGGYSPSTAAWNTWTVNPGGGGVFIGNSNNNGGSGSSLGINSNGKAFGLFNSSGSVTEVIRNFPALQVGQTFQVDLDNGSVNSGGTVGIALQNANGNNVWEFLFSGGSTFYTIIAGSVSPSVNIPFTTNGLRISFTLTSSTTYSASIQVLNGGLNYGPFTGTLSNPAGGQNISRFRAFNFQAGSGSTNDFFINNIIGPSINDNASFYGAFANGTVSPNPTVGGIWSGITPSPSNNTSGILIVNPIPNVAVQPSPLCSGNNLTVSASGAGTYEFFLGGVSQGAPSATSSFTFPTLTAGQQVCVRGYPSGPVIDGNISEPFWGNPIVTSAGGPSSSVSNNRINALYVNNQLGFLSLGIAGNLLNSTNTENDQKILIFIDSRSGGFNSLSGWTNRTNAPNLSVENLNSGISFDAGFIPDFILCIGTDNTGAAFFDLYDLTNNTNTFLGSSSGNPTLFGFQSNSGSTDYTKGFEIRIRNSLLGIISSPLRFFAMVVNTPVISNVTIVSNQFLSPAGSGDGSYGSGSISFGSAAPNPVSYSLSPDCLDDECLTVRATPVVSAPASFCVNNQITLSPTTGGTWTSSNNGIATVNNAGVATGVSIGQTSFTFTTVDGCSSITSPVNVNQVLTSTIQTN